MRISSEIWGYSSQAEYMFAKKYPKEGNFQIWKFTILQVIPEDRVEILSMCFLIHLHVPF
jgi:hypothetical protein